MEKAVHDTVVMETCPVLNYIACVKMSQDVSSIQDRMLAFEQHIAWTNANCNQRKNFQSSLAVPSIKDRLRSFQRSNNASTVVNERRKVFEKPPYYDVSSVKDRLGAFQTSSDSSHMVGQKTATTIMSPAAPELGFRIKALKASHGVSRLNKTWPPNAARICADKSRDRSDAKVMSGAVERLVDAIHSHGNVVENATKNFTPGTASLGGGEIHRGTVTREIQPTNNPVSLTDKMEMMAVPRKINPKFGSVMRMVDKFDRKRKQ